MTAQNDLSFSPRIRTLLVDLDGTLLANKDLPLRLEFVIRAIRGLKKQGSPLRTLRAIRAMNEVLHLPASSRLPELTNDRRSTEAFAEAMDLSFDEAKKVLHELITGVFPELERHFYPVEGAKDFLDWARKRFPLYLATNPVWPVELVELRLKWAGIDPKIFRSMTHAGRMHACKPAPEYYEELLEQEKLRADECLLIGDDVKRDLPATKVGIRVFILSDGLAKPFPLRVDRPQAWSGGYKDLQRLLGGHAAEGHERFQVDRGSA